VSVALCRIADRLLSALSFADRMKDESRAAAAEDVEALLAPAPTPHRFVHSHPKPRDPADPTVRPWPRGRPRGEKIIAASSLSFRSALRAEQEAMQVEEEREEKKSETAGEAEEKAAEGKYAEDDAQEVRSSRVLRSRGKKAAGRGGSSSSSIISMLDSDDERDDTQVSYVDLGRPARRRRNKHSSTSIHGSSSRRSGSRTRGSRMGGLLANWHRIPGHGEN
jgi:hypothetical protein